MSPTAFALHTILFFVLLSLIGCGKTQKSPDPAAADLRIRLSAEGAPRQLSVGAESVFSPGLVQMFYERREFQPAWTSETGSLPLVDSLLREIKRCHLEGLNPADYHLRSIEETREALDSEEDRADRSVLALRADLDLLLTDAYMMYASHLAEGKIERDSMKVRWAISEDWDRFASGLESALSSGDGGLNLRPLAPAHEMYADLCELLQKYESQAAKGGWGLIPSAAVLRPGERGRSVLLVRNRLRSVGDLTARGSSVGDEFDSTLVDAVRIFQRRHGLEQNGIVDSVTMVALNVSPARRVEQIKANLERWRWMPRILGRQHLRVNIPDFMLTVSEGGRVVMSMKVVLGLPNWQTPVFSSEMEQVLFNSHWMAPEDIVEKEMINYMMADSNYLPSNNMSLWRKSGDSLVKIDPRTINWPEMTSEKIDFHLRQEGGPQNIMGQVKFLIPNKYNVYLHDTPYREDFPKNVRMFSHGCIRLEKPFDFAEYVLQQFPEWTRTKIDTVVARRTEHLLRLKKTIPVHIVYSTVWKASDGSIQFRDDYYGLDRRLIDILSQTVSR